MSTTPPQSKNPFSRFFGLNEGTRLDPARAKDMAARSLGAASAPARAPTPAPAIAPRAPAASHDPEFGPAYAGGGGLSGGPTGGLSGSRPSTPAGGLSGSSPQATPPGQTSFRTSLGFDGKPRGGPAAAAPTPKKIVYSDEQRGVIESEYKTVLADAFAGCGKTTTAVGFCEHRPNKKILYLVLNTANADEARKRFPRNVSPMTFHSLAYNSQGMREHVGARLDRRWGTMSLMREFNMRTGEAFSVRRVLEAYFCSADLQISEKHAAELISERNSSPAEVNNAVARAKEIWQQISNPAGKCSMPDDAYLKVFANRRPSLDYDCIILDEAQDANPLSASILGCQLKPQMLFIGDRHQSIYAFRRSLNAMEKFTPGADHHHLTKTYRFGPKVAELANLILGELKGETHKIVGMGQDGAWRPSPVTMLSRSNAELFSIAAQRRGEGIHWIGKDNPGGYVVGRDGPDNYRLTLLEDVYHLYAREVGKIRDRGLREIGTFADYKRYGEETRDGEARVLLKLVEEHGHDTPALIQDIRRNAVPNEASADVVLTTAHKSKGLEWDCVRLCEDFKVLEAAEAELAETGRLVKSEQDVNLLYVAATRARTALHPNTETTQWLEKLEQHRQDRSGAKHRERQGLRG